eukprot:m.440504 g.440504  ORF g.440504 m.440504 type:complete len:179 (+) comp20278_c9_seq3:1324-1860(+)
MTVVFRGGSRVDVGSTRLLILGKPMDHSLLDEYIADLKRHNVKVLVRACRATYDTGKLASAGITVVDLPIDDGGVPVDEQVQVFLELVRQTFERDDKAVMAIHCVAGLGRSCVLAALALVNQERIDPLDAAQLIRKHRHGAFNKQQLRFVAMFRPRRTGTKVQRLRHWLGKLRSTAVA